MNSIPPMMPEVRPLRRAMIDTRPKRRPARPRFGLQLRAWFGGRRANPGARVPAVDWEFRFRGARAKGEHRAASAMCRAVLARRPRATRWWVRLALSESDREMHIDALQALENALGTVGAAEWEALNPAIERVTRRALIAAEQRGGAAGDRLRLAAWDVRRFAGRADR